MATAQQTQSIDERPAPSGIDRTKVAARPKEQVSKSCSDAKIIKINKADSGVLLGTTLCKVNEKIIVKHTSSRSLQARVKQ
jgi:hypothetical protein